MNRFLLPKWAKNFTAFIALIFWLLASRKYIDRWQ